MEKPLDRTIADLVIGRLDTETLRLLQRQEKEEGRFIKVLRAVQTLVPWSDTVVLPLQENLFVVRKPDGTMVVKCQCGHEFGDYRRNWKLNALVYERDPHDDEVYSRENACDSNWMVIREFICPDCGTQLEVEAIPPGHPIVFSVVPDIEGYFAAHPDEWEEIIGA